MSRNILLILADAAEAKAVRRSLSNSRDGPFNVEWVSRCAAAIERLGDPREEEIAAIVVGLCLADSQGIETFDTLFCARPDVPILVLSRLRDENVARLAVQRGVVLLPEVAHSEDATLSARKILAALSTPHRIEQQELHVTVSVGIGVYPEDGTDAETLLKNADTALRNAKAQGRSNHQFFSQTRT